VKTDAWLRLLQAAGHGGHRWVRALREAGSAAALTSHNARSLRRLGLHSKDIERLRAAPAEPPGHWKKWLEAADHTLVVFGSEAYPKRLAELEDAPLALWVDGRDTALLGQPQLAIVGSRHPTRNGLDLAEAFAAELSHAGITITSGLALGIDAASHRGALTGIGATIAVLGNGIDHVYPAANRGLATQIRERGLIVSEYPPAIPARAPLFPKRNRIIAALALGTIVIEATRRSGSLITARLAAECGREVFAVPGSIHSPLSKGCHQLIRDGAALVEKVDHIVSEIEAELRVTLASPEAATLPETGNELPAALAGHLGYSPITLDSLASVSGLTAAELSSMLLHLEIQGKIEALPGGRYCRLAKRA
jgi:DNA processing protein